MGGTHHQVRSPQAFSEGDDMKQEQKIDLLIRASFATIILIGVIAFWIGYLL